MLHDIFIVSLHNISDCFNNIIQHGKLHLDISTSTCHLFSDHFNVVHTRQQHCVLHLTLQCITYDCCTYLTIQQQICAIHLLLLPIHRSVSKMQATLQPLWLNGHFNSTSLAVFSVKQKSIAVQWCAIHSDAFLNHAGCHSTDNQHISEVFSSCC